MPYPCCCETVCANCTGEKPSQITVAITGSADGNCTGWTSVDGTYTLDEPDRESCYWEGSFTPTMELDYLGTCTTADTFTMQLTLSSGSVRLTISVGYSGSYELWSDTAGVFTPRECCFDTWTPFGTFGAIRDSALYSDGGDLSGISVEVNGVDCTPPA